MVEKRIHFVDRTGANRSVLAASYAKSLKLPGFAFTSSGIAVDKKTATVISPQARALARKYQLVAWLPKHKAGTSNAILRRQDIVIFLSKDVYDEAVSHLQFDARKCLVWDTPDLETHRTRHKISKHDQETANIIADNTLRRLATQVRALLVELTADDWVDLYDHHNQPLGYALPTRWAEQRKGLWRRYVHAVITTADKKYVVERRTDQHVLAPSRLHFSMDGPVAGGETPRQAVQRNLQTKFGVTITPEQTFFQSVKKYSTEQKVQSDYAYYTKYSNTFVYTYHVALTLENPLFVAPEDNREILLLNRRHLLSILRHPAPSMKKQLLYGREHYAKAVKRAKI